MLCAGAKWNISAVSVPLNSEAVNTELATIIMGLMPKGLLKRDPKRVKAARSKKAAAKRKTWTTIDLSGNTERTTTAAAGG